MEENEESDLNKCDDNLEGDNFDFEVSLKCNNISICIWYIDIDIVEILYLY